MSNNSSKDNPVTADETVIRIKKYPNRRLYNTATSQYIVLEDIVELVRQGQEFVIEDTKTGEDLTRAILSQVIFERESAKADFHFPLDVQKQLIRMYDDAYAKMMPDYLRESMNLFVSERDKMKNAFEEMVEYNSKTMTRFGEQLAQQNMDYFKQAFDMFQAMSGMGMTPPEKASGVPEAEPISEENTTNDSQLEELQNQIDQLQDQLKSIKK